MFEDGLRQNGIDGDGPSLAGRGLAFPHLQVAFVQMDLTQVSALISASLIPAFKASVRASWMSGERDFREYVATGASCGCNSTTVTRAEDAQKRSDRLCV